MLTDWLGEHRLVDFGVRFLRQVWPGDTLTARATVTGRRHTERGELVELALSTVNQQGDEVVSGTATARLG
jgi:acyl dehydratase